MTLIKENQYRSLMNWIFQEEGMIIMPLSIRLLGPKFNNPKQREKVSNVNIAIGDNAIWKTIPQGKDLTLAACLLDPSAKLGGVKSF